MRSPSGPPGFNAQDWSQFDFSRWHTDGLRLESVSAAFADLAERLVNAPEWRQNFQAALPALRPLLLDEFRERGRALEAESAALAQAFQERSVRVREQAAALQDRARRAAAPVSVTPDPT